MKIGLERWDFAWADLYRRTYISSMCMYQSTVCDKSQGGKWTREEKSWEHDLITRHSGKSLKIIWWGQKKAYKTKQKNIRGGKLEHCGEN